MKKPVCETGFPFVIFSLGKNFTFFFKYIRASGACGTITIFCAVLFQLFRMERKTFRLIPENLFAERRACECKKFVYGFDVLFQFLDIFFCFRFFVRSADGCKPFFCRRLDFTASGRSVQKCVSLFDNVIFDFVRHISPKRTRQTVSEIFSSF